MGRDSVTASMMICLMDRLCLPTRRDTSSQTGRSRSAPHTSVRKGSERLRRIRVLHQGFTDIVDGLQQSGSFAVSRFREGGRMERAPLLFRVPYLLQNVIRPCCQSHR